MQKNRNVGNLQSQSQPVSVGCTALVYLGWVEDCSSLTERDGQGQGDFSLLPFILTYLNHIYPFITKQQSDLWYCAEFNIIIYPYTGKVLIILLHYVDFTTFYLCSCFNYKRDKLNWWCKINKRQLYLSRFFFERT